MPMQLHYDNTKLALINVDTGDFLGHDGQAIALVHRDDGVGNVVISASRPPGVAGVNGAGTVCVLTFQANAAGDAAMQTYPRVGQEQRATVRKHRRLTNRDSHSIGPQYAVHLTSAQAIGSDARRADRDGGDSCHPGVGGGSDGALR